MNLQQFLEKEHKDFVNIPDLDDYLCTSISNIDEWIEKHDTRLINFVLDKVKEEVEKKKEFMDLAELMCEIVYYDDISAIIDNMKIK